jgi:uncharacterized protein YkuJ
LQYEKLKSDPRSAYGRVLKYLDITYEEGRLKRAIEQSSIEKVRAMDSKIENTKEDKGENKRDRRFARSGKSMQWVDYFDSKDQEYYRTLIPNKGKFPYS